MTRPSSLRIALWLTARRPLRSWPRKAPSHSSPAASAPPPRAAPRADAGNPIPTDAIGDAVPPCRPSSVTFPPEVHVGHIDGGVPDREERLEHRLGGVGGDPRQDQERGQPERRRRRLARPHRRRHRPHDERRAQRLPLLDRVGAPLSDARGVRRGDAGRGGGGGVHGAAHEARGRAHHADGHAQPLRAPRLARRRDSPGFAPGVGEPEDERRVRRRSAGAMAARAGAST